MRHLIIVILVFLFSQLGTSQVEVSGVLKDKNGPIEFATVSLKDTTLAIRGYAYTGEDGSFIITTQKGKYMMIVDALGYKDWRQEIVTGDDGLVFGEMVVETEATELGEVVVTGKVQLFERKPDRLIFNVANSIAASGGNALDALRVAPGLKIGNDAISIIGRGATGVMINGRLLQLSGEDLVNFLNSIAASDIQKIEIIRL